MHLKKVKNTRFLAFKKGSVEFRNDCGNAQAVVLKIRGENVTNM
jgi:hypothetical protein